MCCIFLPRRWTTLTRSLASLFSRIVHGQASIPRIGKSLITCTLLISLWHHRPSNSHSGPYFQRTAHENRLASPLSSPHDRTNSNSTTIPLKASSGNMKTTSSAWICTTAATTNHLLSRRTSGRSNTSNGADRPSTVINCYVLIMSFIIWLVIIANI